MTTPTPGATAPRVTARLPFARANAVGDFLFEVRPGVPAIDAMELASCYMASARDLAAACAAETEGDTPDHLWGAYYLIELAKAALDSSIATLSNEEFARTRSLPPQGATA